MYTSNKNILIVNVEMTMTRLQKQGRNKNTHDKSISQTSLHKCQSSYHAYDDSKLVYKLYCHVTSLCSPVSTKQDRIAPVDLELIKSMESQTKYIFTFLIISLCHEITIHITLS